MRCNYRSYIFGCIMVAHSILKIIIIEGLSLTVVLHRNHVSSISAISYSKKIQINHISPMYFSPFEEERKWILKKSLSLFGIFSSPTNHSQRSLTVNETEQRKWKFKFCRRLGCGAKNPSRGMIGAWNIVHRECKTTLPGGTSNLTPMVTQMGQNVLVMNYEKCLLISFVYLFIFQFHELNGAFLVSLEPSEHKDGWNSAG